MDQRVFKTKTALKNALIKNVHDKDFDQINVQGICVDANVNRVTFYTHYHDKYELLEDIFNDMDIEATKLAAKLDLENNQKHDAHQSFVNYLQSFVEGLKNYENLVFSMSKNQSGYIYYAFKSFIINKLRDLLLYYNQEKNLLFPLEQTTAFICYGLIGFVIEGITLQTKNLTEVFLDAQVLFHKLIDNSIFLKK